LRNHGEFRNLPNYMHKDMRKKGEVSYDFKVRSSIKKYIDDNPVVKKDNNKKEDEEKKEEKKEEK